MSKKHLQFLFHSVLRIAVSLAIAGCAITHPRASSSAPQGTDRAAQALGVGSDELAPSPVPGLLQFTHAGEVAYVTSDGKYLLHGDLIELTSGANLTARARGDLLRTAFQKLPDKAIITFSPRPGVTARYAVYVFSDLDCGYCRRLHAQIAEYNALGIEVRYLAWPRSGPGTPSWHKAEGVWCAREPNDAVSAAMLGHPVGDTVCEKPVQAGYDLGVQLGVHGTPTFVFSDGSVLPGYLTPTALLARLSADPPTAAVVNRNQN